MATVRWIGNAKVYRQIDTYRISTYDAATTYKITINGKLVSVVGNTDAATTAADLLAALQAATDGEFTEIEWEVSTDTVTATGPDDGAPVTITSSVTGGAGAITHTAVQAAAGPHDVAVAKNWSGGAVPSGGDTVYFDLSDVDCLYNLGQLTGVALAAIYVRASFTGRIGLMVRNPNSYDEYRPRYFVANPAILQIGAGIGGGSGLLRFNTEAVTCAIEVIQTAGPLETNLPSFTWIGTGAANTVETQGGSFGAALLGGESAVISTARYSAGDVFLGNVAQTTQLIGLASVTQQTGSTTLTIYDRAVVNANGTGGFTNINLYAGRLNYNNSGNVSGTVTIGGPLGAVLDCSGDPSPRTFANTIMIPNATIVDPQHTITHTTGIIPGLRANQTQVT
jgi:hypothetical protein